MSPLKDKYAKIIKECTIDESPYFTAQPRTTIKTVKLKMFPILSSKYTIYHLFQEDKRIVKKKYKLHKKTKKRRTTLITLIDFHLYIFSSVNSKINFVYLLVKKNFYNHIIFAL